MATIPGFNNHLFPSVEQVFIEAKRIARDDRDKAHDFTFSKQQLSCSWFWSKRHLSRLPFDYDGYIRIGLAASEGPYARHKDAYWIRPNRISLEYCDNRIYTEYENGYVVILRFRLNEDTPIGCGRKPPATLHSILEKLDIAQARVWQSAVKEE